METQNDCIKYNYYPINCINIRNSSINNDTKIATYQGKVNEPNIMYNNGSEIINYQAKELFVCSKIHAVNKNQDGEIIIIHSPTTSSIKLYVCFPFLYNDNTEITDIDKILFSSTKTNSISLEMNKYITIVPKVRIYETYDSYGEQCRVILFEDIIYINHKINIPNNTNLIQKESIEKAISTYPFLTNAKNYQDSIILESTLRSPSFLSSNSTNVSSDSLLSLPSSLFIHNETIVEGMETNDRDDVIYSCEYLPIDSDDMVQVLQVPVGSPGYNNLVGSQVSNLFINHGIFMFIVILFFCLTPFCYHFFYTRINESQLYKNYFLDRIDWTIFRGINMNLYNLILLIMVFTLTLFLLIFGFSFGNSTASSIGLFLPFSTFISYLGISFFYKNNVTSTTSI